MSAPRVGLVGARTARQGLGPYVARDLRAAGVEVPCFLATSKATLAEAAAQLRERGGVEARGYTRLDRMLESERLEALAILSPAATHEHYLRATAEAGLHALCEKPLLWGGEELATRAAARIRAFRERGLLLAENCQWPFALGAFRELHPSRPRRTPRRFRMWLSPTSRGPQQIGDCLPHALSLLQELAPAERVRIENTTIRPTEGDSRTLVVFDYLADGNSVEACVELLCGGRQPRRAGFEIDGLRAERIVQMPEYTMELTDDGRSVPFADPLTARIASFADELRAVCAGGEAPSPAPLEQRMRLLEAIAQAWPEAVDG